MIRGVMRLAGIEFSWGGRAGECSKLSWWIDGGDYSYSGVGQAEGRFSARGRAEEVHTLK
jgi:hypothetical protein